MNLVVQDHWPALFIISPSCFFFDPCCMKSRVVRTTILSIESIYLLIQPINFVLPEEAGSIITLELDEIFLLKDLRVNLCKMCDMFF